MSNKTEKKVSIRAFDQVMRDEFPNTETVQWRGLEITVRKTLPLREMLAFVNDVVSSCFQKENGYMPELRDFAVRSNILTRYANFRLPDNLETRYELLYRTDAVQTLTALHINAGQLEEILAAIDRKLDALCRSDASRIQDQAEKLAAAFEKLQGDMEKTFGGLFSELTPEDVRRVAAAIGENGLDEDKLVASYLRQTGGAA